MTDYAELIGANRLYAATLRQVDSERDQREADYLEENATALETLLRERDEARLQCDGLEERGDLALKELNEARIGVVDGGIRSGKLQAEVARLTAENARLREALSVPKVWTQEETDGLLEAWKLAYEVKGRGTRETLFAVAAWILTHRRQALGEPND